MKALRSPRTSCKLSDSVHFQLSRYALAASAAGVGALALAQPAEAKIIYTKTHRVIGHNDIYPLDLNRDGTVDFIIQQLAWMTGSLTCNASSWKGLFVKEGFGNAVAGSRHRSEYRSASALKKDAPIGPDARFVSATGYRGERMATVSCVE